MDAEALAAIYGDMPERVLQGLCETALVQAGWLVYHTRDSRGSRRGFPDIVAIRNQRIIYRELKDQTGRLTTDQKVWKLALETAGADWGLWRPLMWGIGEVLREIA